MNENAPLRTARCSCGSLAVKTHGEPAELYLCSCTVCQQRSGSAFSYAAIFPQVNAMVHGEHRAWRRNGDSGRWIENHFCPTCGVAVFFYSEGLPGLIGVSVGALGDPDFPKPTRIYWASRKHHWLDLPADVEQVERQ